MAWMLERIRSTTLGVNALLANLLRRVWLGGSDIIYENKRVKDWIFSAASAGSRSLKALIWAEERRWSRNAARPSV